MTELMDRGHRSAVRVGVGVPESVAEEIRNHLSKGRSGVQVVACSDATELVSSLKDRTVDCAVRGTLSSVKVLNEMRRLFSLKQVMRAAILEDVRGKQFLLAPVGIDEGSDKRSRLELAKATVSYFSDVGWTLKIGVLSKGRQEDSGRTPEIEESLNDGEWLVETLERSDIKAEHYSILIEDAVSESDLVLAPDGVSGNLIFRAMYFLGGGKAFGAPVVNMDRVFVDTTRAKCDFADSVLLAAGLVQAKKAALK